MLDARGVWANLLRDADGLAGLPVRDGGRIALRGTGDVAVDAGSVLDVTAGASLVSDGKLQGGKGGNVTLASHVLGQIPSNGGLLSFAGEVRGYGVTGGGTLSVASGGKIVLGGLDAQDATTLRLDPSLFSTGFGKYEINGYGPDRRGRRADRRAHAGAAAGGRRRAGAGSGAPRRRPDALDAGAVYRGRCAAR